MSASGPPSDDLPPCTSHRAAVVRVGEIPQRGSVRSSVASTNSRECAPCSRRLARGRRPRWWSQGEPGIGKTTLLEAAERMATGFRCLWVRGVESESVLAHAGLLQALGPLRDGLAEIPGAQATALSVGSRVGTGGGSFRALPGCRGGAVHARRGVRTGTGAGAGRRPAVGRPRVGSRTRVRGSSPPRGPGVLRVGGAKRLDPAGVRAGNAGPDPRRPVPRRRPRPGTGSRGGWSRRSPGRRHRRQPARDPGDRPPPHRRPASGCRAAARRAARGRPSWTRVRSSSSPACPHRPGAPYCCRRSTARAPPQRWRRRWSGRSVDVAAALDEAQDRGVLVRHGAELGFRHPLLRTAALALATAAQQRSAHRALADVLAADPHSLAGTWHRAEAAAGPDHQLAQDLVRAADQSRTRQGYAAASAAMERAALLAGRRCADRGLDGDGGRGRLSGRRRRSNQVAGGSRAGRAESASGARPGPVHARDARAVRRFGAVLPSSFSPPPLSGSTVTHRTRALAELALARFRLNDMAGIGECAARIDEAADRSDPEQRMLSDFTRGVAATLGGDPAAGQVLLQDVIERISRPAASRRPAIAALPRSGQRLPG